MSYPTLEQYNEAFQYPQLALADSELKQGSIATSGLGLPLALCGGFALTYTMNSGTRKYAVRCFHKKSNELEKRYSSISTRLKSLQSPYFVEFEFQPQGVRISGKLFPIVKMAWASGTTLGEFLEKNYRNSTNLLNLRVSLRSLAKYLESQGIAHGDIQPGNVMVADAGKKIQLIDYDGIFIDDLMALGSAELGHRNFQHPKRVSSSWDATLDRFSFISLDLAIRALASNPEFWLKTRSDGDSILFKANDFADPSNSSIFGSLVGEQIFAEDAKYFATVCRSNFNKTPTLEDFLAKRNLPQAAIAIANATKIITSQYLSAFPVLDATNYSLGLGFIGDKIELVGKIFEIKQNITRQGKPYVFINFGSWLGHIIKINIWSEGLSALNDKPNESWVGKWISVVGLMEPPYVNPKFNYSHLSVSITQGRQIHLISEQEARFRLEGSSARAAISGAKSSNQEILESLKTGSDANRSIPLNTSNPVSRTSTVTCTTSNQAVLQKILTNQPVATPVATPTPAPSTTSRQPSPPQRIAHIDNASQKAASYPSTPIDNSTKGVSSSNNCFIATAVYGSDAPETNALRQWRDSSLLRHFLGRVFVSAYYFISPRLVPLVARSKWIRIGTKSVLNRIVHAVSVKKDSGHSR